MIIKKEHYNRYQVVCFPALRIPALPPIPPIINHGPLLSILFKRMIILVIIKIIIITIIIKRQHTQRWRTRLCPHQLQMISMTAWFDQQRNPFQTLHHRIVLDSMCYRIAKTHSWARVDGWMTHLKQKERKENKVKGIQQHKNKIHDKKYA